jgi:hypothetical protein
MRSKRSIGFVLVGLILMLTFTLTARSGANRGGDRDRDDRDRDHDRNASNAPLKFLGIIAVPGSPISSTDIAVVDQATERLYIADRRNGPTVGSVTFGSVEIIDAENDLFVGRVTSNTSGTLHFAGVTSPTTHEGPNGIVATADKKVWAADGDSTVKVADVDPSSPTYLQIIASISTAGQTSVSGCTGGTAGTCNRADEIAYDPADNIIMVANDEPNLIPPFVTFIDANFPYTVLGQMNFAAQGLANGNGLEQPLWDPGLHRFLQTLPKTNPDVTGAIAVVNPIKRTVDRVISLKSFGCSPSGEALGSSQHVVVSCGAFPLVVDVLTGNEVGPGINQVGGGDEVNYNPGDNRFIVSSNVEGNSTYPTVLGVINAETGDWLQNLPPATLPSGMTPGSGGLATSGRAGNLAAFEENNHVFVIVHPAASPATDICGTFGGVDYGCVAVFGPTGEDPDTF